MGTSGIERLSYFVVDAFASEVFRGNPAGVCPLERWLPDQLLQAIAAENNLAETAFFVAAGAGYQLRWFAPLAEVPLCGHATLAAASIIFTHFQPGLREVRFQTASGVLTVRRDGEWLELDLPKFSPAPVTEPPADLLQGLGVLPDAVLRVDPDPNFYAVFADAAVVRQLQPDLGRLARLHPYGVVATAPGVDRDFVSRYFLPSFGIPEDPATGSIHAALTPYWAARLGRSELRAQQASRRGGELRCVLDAERVRVAGCVSPYLEGTIRVPRGAGD